MPLYGICGVFPRVSVAAGCTELLPQWPVVTHIGRAVTSTVERQQMAGHAAEMVHYFSISAQLRGMFTVTGTCG
jgi:hypothetical protein